MNEWVRLFDLTRDTTSRKVQSKTINLYDYIDPVKSCLFYAASLCSSTPFHAKPYINSPSWFPEPINKTAVLKLYSLLVSFLNLKTEKGIGAYQALAITQAIALRVIERFISLFSNQYSAFPSPMQPLAIPSSVFPNPPQASSPPRHHEP